MKTFETEKGNIPEGATHYQDETSSDNFAWCKGVGTEGFMVKMLGDDDWDCEVESLYINDIKPIPQTKEVEWVNGDKCVYEGALYDYQCVSSWDKGACVLSGASPEAKPFTDVWIEELSKPETEAEKLERERIEAAKHLYAKHCVAVRHPFKDLDNNKELLDAWLVIVDETGYRKGE